MAQENYQSSNYQSSSSGSYQTSLIPVIETYQGSSNSVSDTYNSSSAPVQMYAPSTETEILSKIQEVSEEPSQMYQSDEAIEEMTATEDDSVGYSGPQRPCCGRGCYDCVLFTR